jgi:hypothetical protein
MQKQFWNSQLLLKNNQVSPLFHLPTQFLFTKYNKAFITNEIYNMQLCCFYKTVFRQPKQIKNHHHLLGKAKAVKIGKSA